MLKGTFRPNVPKAPIPETTEQRESQRWWSKEKRYPIPNVKDVAKRCPESVTGEEYRWNCASAFKLKCSASLKSSPAPGEKTFETLCT